VQVAQLALQLYTVRDALESAPERTLTGLSSMGYRNVELAGTAGLSPLAFRELLDAHDLAVVGAHVGLDRLGDGFDATLDDLETLGCRYAIVPWLPPERRGGRDVGRWLGETLNGLAERASARGIRIGYHNHDFEFAGSPADRLWDGLLETAGSSVRLELDVCWARVAGEDPAALISSLPARIESLHLKDVDADLRTPRIPGAGVLPWREIIDAGDAAGVEWFVIEEDEPADSMEAAKLGLDVIRRLATP
jgi:sugar phosphate isomerase/epimerase